MTPSGCLGNCGYLAEVNFISYENITSNDTTSNEDVLTVNSVDAPVTSVKAKRKKRKKAKARKADQIILPVSQPLTKIMDIRQIQGLYTKDILALNTDEVQVYQYLSARIFWLAGFMVEQSEGRSKQFWDDLFLISPFFFRLMEQASNPRQDQFKIEKSRENLLLCINSILAKSEQQERKPHVKKLDELLFALKETYQGKGIDLPCYHYVLTQFNHREDYKPSLEHLKELHIWIKNTIGCMRRIYDVCQPKTAVMVMDGGKIITRKIIIKKKDAPEGNEREGFAVFDDLKELEELSNLVHLFIRKKRAGFRDLLTLLHLIGRKTRKYRLALVGLLSSSADGESREIFKLAGLKRSLATFDFGEYGLADYKNELDENGKIAPHLHLNFVIISNFLRLIRSDFKILRAKILQAIEDQFLENNIPLDKTEIRLFIKSCRTMYEQIKCIELSDPLSRTSMFSIDGDVNDTQFMSEIDGVIAVLEKADLDQTKIAGNILCQAYWLKDYLSEGISNILSGAINNVEADVKDIVRYREKFQNSGQIGDLEDINRKEKQLLEKLKYLAVFLDLFDQHCRPIIQQIETGSFLFSKVESAQPAAQKKKVPRRKPPVKSPSKVVHNTQKPVEEVAESLSEVKESTSIANEPSDLQIQDDDNYFEEPEVTSQKLLKITETLAKRIVDCRPTSTSEHESIFNVKTSELIQELTAIGWRFLRQKSSGHKIYKHPDFPQIGLASVPVHGGKKPVSPGVVKDLRQKIDQVKELKDKLA